MAKETIRILIVDDDALLAESIAELFERFPVQVFTAHSVDEAIELLDAQSFSLVISDVRMPGKDGFYLLDYIKKKKADFPRVIFISGFAIDKMTAYQRGIEGFMEKPFDIDEAKRLLTRSLLRKEDWWRLPVNRRDGRIHKKFYDWEELLKSKQIGFGTGGLFLSHDLETPKEGQVYEFKIEFLSGHPVRKILGQGIVRWVRAEDDGPMPAGVGLEIIYIKQESLRFFIDYIQRLTTKSVIPISGDS